MKADLSRITFRPQMEYTRVVAQQGRVDLDADRNEVQDIQLARLRMAIMDLFGPFGGPRFLWDAAGDWGRPNEAFRIQIEDDDLTYGAGRYYVDGWACSTQGGRYMEQASLPWNEEHADHAAFELPDPPYLAYLDVWERLVTSLEDEAIREVALDGPDTAARSQLICQVRWLADADLPAGVNGLGDFSADPDDAASFRNWWVPILNRLRGENRPRLKVEARRPPDAGENPCLAGAEAGYLGPENQLYRVEIHAVDEDGNATFKYSRNNGADVAALLEIDGQFLRIGGVYEPSRGFSAGQWVELTDNEHELLGIPGTMVQVTRVEGSELVIDTNTANGSLDPEDFQTDPKVRRWDQSEKGPVTLNGGLIEVVEGEWLPLEYGIRVMFEQNGDREYRPGDYWVFPARYLTGNVEWPKDTFLPPHGVAHSYAPLAMVRAANDIVDLRVLRDTWSIP